MSDLSQEGLLRLARRVGWICSWLTVAVAFAVLIGWKIGSQRLISVVPGLVAMNPLTAACFILSAAALLIRPRDATSPRIWQPIALASVVGICGLTRLVGYLLSWNVPIDRVLFSSQLALGGDPPNRMAPNTALRCGRMRHG